MLNENKINRQFKILFEEETSKRDKTIENIKQMLFLDDQNKMLAVQLMLSQGLNWNTLGITQEEFERLVGQYQETDSEYEYEIGKYLDYELYYGDFYTLNGKKYRIEEKVYSEEQYQWLGEGYLIYEDDDFIEQVSNYKEALDFLSNN